MMYTDNLYINLLLHSTAGEDNFQVVIPLIFQVMNFEGFGNTVC
jgi:hypothetical protein